MRITWQLLTGATLISVCPTLTADDAKLGTTPIEGNWVVESATFGDLNIEVMGKDKRDVKSFSWVFTGKTYKAFVNEGVAGEEGTFHIDADKTPKHLDLMPTKGELLTTQKCIYSLDGDVLKVALTLWFAPGSPDDEEKEAKKMRATRPTSLDKTKDNLALVLVLRRKKG
jgi:uncharacterized protein (TIGR03067 family)